jgi:S-adenosyl methyltransferase
MSESPPEQRPTAGGMYDFYLGGTENSPADRAAAEQVIRHIPPVTDTAWANRGFLQRAVRRMAAEWGIRQFLDIGAGLPTQRNTHDVVAEVIEDGRVVYVDNDPLVVARGRELLAKAAQDTGEARAATAARTAVILGDLRQPDAILDHEQTRRLIDLTAPIGVLMVAVLHFVPDEDDPYGLVKRFMDAVPAGSYLALSHISADQMVLTEELAEALRVVYAQTPTPPLSRTRYEIARFFRRLAIVPPYPGAASEVTFVGLWGAEDAEAADSEGARWTYAAVARKP